MSNPQLYCKLGSGAEKGQVDREGADDKRCTRKGQVGRPLLSKVLEQKLLCAHEDCRTPEGGVWLVFCSLDCVARHWKISHPGEQVEECAQEVADAWAAALQQVSAPTGARYAPRRVGWRTLQLPSLPTRAGPPKEAEKEAPSI